MSDVFVVQNYYFFYVGKLHQKEAFIQTCELGTSWSGSQCEERLSLQSCTNKYWHGAHQ